MGGKTKKIAKNCEKKWADKRRKQQKTMRKNGRKTKKIAKNCEKKMGRKTKKNQSKFILKML